MTWYYWMAGVLSMLVLAYYVVGQITKKLDEVISEIQNLRGDVETLHHDLSDIESKIGQTPAN